MPSETRVADGMLRGVYSRIQSGGNIVPNSIYVFNADRETQQAEFDAHFHFHIMRHAAVGLVIAMVDQTFHSAEAGSHFDQFHVFNHAIGRFTRVVFKINRNHAADAFGHLCLGEFVMFVRRQAGIEHFFNGRMGFQTARDFECVLAMGVHA